MAFQKNIIDTITGYVYGHLPEHQWYEENFFPFIKDEKLRGRLITEYTNARVIYKLFEGIQAKDELLLAQIKTQVIMYVSIQEAVINYVLFEINRETETVKNLLYQEREISVSIPNRKMKQLEELLVHDNKKLIVKYRKLKKVDETKIRYDQKVEACKKIGLISDSLKGDLIKLYEYRNTIHIEAAIKKNLNYDLDMGKLAYRRIEGLSIELSKVLNSLKV